MKTIHRFQKKNPNNPTIKKNKKFLTFNDKFKIVSIGNIQDVAVPLSKEPGKKRVGITPVAE